MSRYIPVTVTGECSLLGEIQDLVDGRGVALPVMGIIAIRAECRGSVDFKTRGEKDRSGERSAPINP